MKLPAPDHPIDVDPFDGRVRVEVDGATVADSHRALRMHEAGHPAVLYVPREDVAMSRLTVTADHTHCPYKGDATYYALRSAGTHGGRGAIAWSYEDPFPAMAAIRGHLAFYPDRVDAIRVGDRIGGPS